MSVPAMAFEVSEARAVPNTVGSTPSLTANGNPSNTPQATGLITVPQSPAGTSVTNTGRSSSSTSSYFSASGTNPGNPLKGWNGVRTPTNPV